MTNKTLLISALYTAALLLAATSCVKDELHDTPHPDTGKVTVTADWSDRGEGVDIPAEWTVTMGDYTGTETGETHSPDYLFSPGSYTLAVYNPADGIMVSGTTAAVVQEAGNGAYISNTPGWLFTSVQEIEIEADTDYALTAVMRQQVRELRRGGPYREYRGYAERSGRDAGLRHGHPQHTFGGGAALHEDN